MSRPDRKLDIVTAVCRRSRVRVVAGRWLLKPDPAHYAEVAAEFGVSVDRVSHLANDRALWAAAWALLARDIPRGVDRDHKDAKRQRVVDAAAARARDGVILESERTRGGKREAGGLFMDSINVTLFEMVNAGNLSDDDARRAREIIEKDLGLRS